MVKKKLTPPERTKGDLALAGARAVIAAVPIVGGSLVEAFNQVVQPPLDKRRTEWMESVGERLEELESQGVDIEALKENEEFITAVMTSTMIAIRNHKREKLEALRNALFNVLEPQAPSEAKQSMFFNLIDEMSVLHIQVLKWVRSPVIPDNVMMGALGGHLQKAFPELVHRGDLTRQIWLDLYNRGLVNMHVDGLASSMTGSGLRENRVTVLGAEFLSFIADHSETD
jgi:hypothetical protein